MNSAIFCSVNSLSSSCSFICFFSAFRSFSISTSLMWRQLFVQSSNSVLHWRVTCHHYLSGSWNSIFPRCNLHPQGLLLRCFLCFRRRQQGFWHVYRCFFASNFKFKFNRQSYCERCSLVHCCFHRYRSPVRLYDAFAYG